MACDCTETGTAPTPGGSAVTSSRRRLVASGCVSSSGAVTRWRGRGIGMILADCAATIEALPTDGGGAGSVGILFWLTIFSVARGKSGALRAEAGPALRDDGGALLSAVAGFAALAEPPGGP